jgi:hypothetical protein
VEKAFITLANEIKAKVAKQEDKPTTTTTPRLQPQTEKKSAAGCC